MAVIFPYILKKNAKFSKNNSFTFHSTILELFFCQNGDLDFGIHLPQTKWYSKIGVLLCTGGDKNFSIFMEFTPLFSFFSTIFDYEKECLGRL